MTLEFQYLCLWLKEKRSGALLSLVEWRRTGDGSGSGQWLSTDISSIMSSLDAGVGGTILSSQAIISGGSSGTFFFLATSSVGVAEGDSSELLSCSLLTWSSSGVSQSASNLGVNDGSSKSLAKLLKCNNSSQTGVGVSERLCTVSKNHHILDETVGTIFLSSNFWLSQQS